MRRLLKDAKQELENIQNKFKDLQNLIYDGVCQLENDQLTSEGHQILAEVCKLSNVNINHYITLYLKVPRNLNFDEKLYDSDIKVIIDDETYTPEDVEWDDQQIEVSNV